MIYLSVGLYAEGPSDYAFLLPFLDRFIEEMAAAIFPGRYEIAETIGIDAAAGKALTRAERIAAAIRENADRCGLFVIHADGASNPEETRRASIDPGVAAAREALPDMEIVTVSCVPVREIEAWLLADKEAFRQLLAKWNDVELPRRPEKESDPKATLESIIQAGGLRRSRGSTHAFLGGQVRSSELRALPAFQLFKSDLSNAIQAVARGQGRHRG